MTRDIGPGRTPRDPARVHDLHVDKQFFDLIAAGRKTVEVRVNSAGRSDIGPGSLLRFTSHGSDVLARVTRVAHYGDFEDMLAHERAASINPTASRDEQLAIVRRIYPPEKEALGVIAIHIELVNAHRPPGTAAAPSAPGGRPR